MSEAIPYADIIILALIAGFILLRLRNVLGQKTGHEDPGFFKRPPPPERGQEPIVQVGEKVLKPKPPAEDTYLETLSDGSLTKTLQEIKAKDPQFSATAFMDGARSAFEMVFDAFNKGDRQTLKLLLSDDLHRQFAGELDARDQEAVRRETTLVAIPTRELQRASLSGNLARLTVRYVSEQVTVGRDGEGTMVEGDPSEIHHVEDEWTFERDITSKNPNWKIIET
jgi:predicted lipid-binding transport protein (Tim44 family)